MSQPLGYVVKSLDHRTAIAVSRNPLPVGEYVSASFTVDDPMRGEKEISTLALVSVTSYLPLVPESVLRFVGPESKPKTPSLKYTESTLYVVAQVDKETEQAEPPRYPIPPDTPLEPASRELLSAVYGSKTGIVRIGLLAPRELGVEVRIDPNKLAKHLFIAGATGSGKSNTVAILADRLSRMGAPVIIFDVHGEYSLTPEDGNTSRVVRVNAKINPLAIPPRMMASIIIPEAQARRQRRALSIALRNLKKKIQEEKEKEKLSTEEAVVKLYEKTRSVRREEEDEEELSWGPQLPIQLFKELLIREVFSLASRGVIDGKQRDTVIDKVEEFFEYTPLTLQEDPVVERARRGSIVVVDSSELSDEQRRWVLKILADSVLNKLKEARGSQSIVLVVEEAPLFLDSWLQHPVKDSLQRLAREGRKFGACLIVVSQRPRNLDLNVVSQLQNFVFLRMVQLDDIRVVANAADSLDEKLASII
ncbi:MAG: ATP-binding protein, partial [Acidilobaceae archaeon]